LDARYDYEEVRLKWDAELVRRPFTMWRYHELLPLRDDANRITMGEGGTPLYPATNLVHFHKTDLDFQVAAARALAQARSRRSLAWATR